MPEPVTICECFARDGLQHEPTAVDTDTKIDVINTFSAAGFKRIEATSYSHPDYVPVFSDASSVLSEITRVPDVWFKATCPNTKAINRAVADYDAGYPANELSLLVSATESHTKKNLRTTRSEQWQRIKRMVDTAGGRFRLIGVISVALGCPFEGHVDPSTVIDDVKRFADLGVSLVTVGDTTGCATPSRVRSFLISWVRWLRRPL